MSIIRRHSRCAWFAELMNAKNWETLFAKTYSDLLELTMELEKNKFLTKQAPYHGGVSAIRRVCKTLAYVNKR